MKQTAAKRAQCSAMWCQSRIFPAFRA